MRPEKKGTEGPWTERQADDSGGRTGSSCHQKGSSSLSKSYYGLWQQIREGRTTTADT